MRHVTLADFLTEEEIDLAAEMYAKDSSSGYADRVLKRIIQPNMARINRALGQENDPEYLAYCVEYVVSTVRRVP